MSHMVIFRTSEGKSGYHQAEALEEAVRFVERMRNEEAVEQARIFRLEEVVFEFRPYFRVELTGVQAPPEVGSPAAEAGPEPHQDGAAEPHQPDDDADSGQNGDGAATAGGRKGLFR